MDWFSCLVILLVALFCITGNWSASLQDVPSCRVDDIQLQEDFDVKKFTGQWYDIGRLEVAGQSPDLTSGYSHFILTDDGKLEMHYVGAIAEECQEPIVGVTETYVGPRLQFSFPSNSPGHLTGPYWVVDTDYTYYTIIYGCHSQAEDGQCAEDSGMVQVLGRQTEIGADDRARLEELMEERLCVDVTKMRYLQHTVICEANQDIYVADAPINTTMEIPATPQDAETVTWVPINPTVEEMASEGPNLNASGQLPDVAVPEVSDTCLSDCRSHPPDFTVTTVPSRDLCLLPTLGAVNEDFTINIIVTSGMDYCEMCGSFTSVRRLEIHYNTQDGRTGKEAINNLQGCSCWAKERLATVDFTLKFYHAVPVNITEFSFRCCSNKKDAVEEERHDLPPENTIDPAILKGAGFSVSGDSCIVGCNTLLPTVSVVNIPDRNLCSPTQGNANQDFTTLIKIGAFPFNYCMICVRVDNVRRLTINYNTTHHRPGFVDITNLNGFQCWKQEKLASATLTYAHIPFEPIRFHYFRFVCCKEGRSGLSQIGLNLPPGNVMDPAHLEASKCIMNCKTQVPAFTIESTPSRDLCLPAKGERNSDFVTMIKHGAMEFMYCVMCVNVTNAEKLVINFATLDGGVAGVDNITNLDNYVCWHKMRLSWARLTYTPLPSLAVTINDFKFGCCNETSEHMADLISKLTSQKAVAPGKLPGRGFPVLGDSCIIDCQTHKPDFTVSTFPHRDICTLAQIDTDFRITAKRDQAHYDYCMVCVEAANAEKLVIEYNTTNGDSGRLEYTDLTNYICWHKERLDTAEFLFTHIPSSVITISDFKFGCCNASGNNQPIAPVSQMLPTNKFAVTLEARPDSLPLNLLPYVLMEMAGHHRPKLEATGCACEGNTCSCCLSLTLPLVGQHEACASAELLSDKREIKVSLTLDTNVLFSETIPVLNPPDICVEVQFMVKLCLAVYNIEINPFGGCLELKVKMAGSVVGTFKIGCFYV